MSQASILLVLTVLLAAPVCALLKQSWRVYFLLLVSFIFYGLFNIGFIAILLFVIAATYAGGLIARKYGRGVFLGSLVAIASPLLFYKYILIWFSTLPAGFIPQSSLDFGGMDEIIIPVGLSFYTFQCLGYVIDIRRGLYTPERNVFKLASFVSFFPQILAGPIERWTDLSKQLFTAERPSPAMVLDGVTLMLYGLFLKHAVAARLAPFVDTVYAQGADLSFLSCLLGLVAFTLQIFADFGGYSLIAVGGAYLFGIRLTMNFVQPFMATSIIDFWQRWHVSLTRWVGDYMYKPMALGLLKHGKLGKRTIEYLALLVTWFAIGMWHGALLNFAVFGLVQCAFIIIHGQFHRRWGMPHTLLFRPLAMAVTLFCVVMSFGLIRAEDFYSYQAILLSMFDGQGRLELPGGKIELLLGLSILAFTEWFFERNSVWSGLRERYLYNSAARIFVLVFLVLAIIFLGYDETSAFIYFRY